MFKYYRYNVLYCRNYSVASIKLVQIANILIFTYYHAKNEFPFAACYIQGSFEYTFVTL